MEDNKKYEDIKNSRIGSDVLDYFIHTFIAQIIATIISALYILMFTDSLVTATNAEFDVSSVVGYSAMIESVTVIIVVFIYYTVIPYLTKGATLGKLAVKLKIVNDDYSRCSFKTLFKRNIRLFVEIIGIIPSILALIGVVELASYIGYSFMAGVIKFGVYIMILSQISKGKLPFHDSMANTMVVHKMYNPNVENYKTITEIEKWADVVGIDKNIAANSNVSVKNEEKKDEDNDNYWGD